MPSIWIANDGNVLRHESGSVHQDALLQIAGMGPDGDEAFDDGSYVLQFDVGDRVRPIAFKRPESLVNPTSVREVWLSSDTFDSALREWRDFFLAEWESLPKHS
jgi:hypothetical protein